MDKSLPSIVPKVFDHIAAARQMRRARARPGDGFILHRACEDLCDRISLIKRDFRDRLDLGTPDGAFARALDVSGGEPCAHAPFDAAGAARGEVHLDGERINGPEDKFDLLVSGFILNRINDLPGFLVQARRLLRADGLLLACLPGGNTLAELRASLMEAEAEVRGGAALRVHPMVDLRDLGGLLQRAGFALPVVDCDSFTVRYSSMFALFDDLRAMGGTGGLVHDGIPSLTKSIVMRAAEIYALRYSDADGKIRVSVDLLWLSGWVPHESQQKPLKPGSATTKLADALGARDLSRLLTERPDGG